MSTEQLENVNQAVNLLVQAAQLAQKRGAYNLDEAALLSQAINILTASSEINAQSTEHVSAGYATGEVEPFPVDEEQ
jgi:hypothetical protein